jgi:hypothetical protein
LGCPHYGTVQGEIKRFQNIQIPDAITKISFDMLVLMNESKSIPHAKQKDINSA